MAIMAHKNWLYQSYIHGEHFQMGKSKSLGLLSGGE